MAVVQVRLLSRRFAGYANKAAFSMRESSTLQPQPLAPGKRRGRPSSPEHRPRTAEPDEDVYVLTLSTDQHLHDCMGALRRRYFPQKIEKTGPHLTLFHALPASKLDSAIVPELERMSASTSSFTILVEKPFRMRKGFAVALASRDGGNQTRQLHKALRNAWSEFLSSQDTRPCRPHYTLMNKVDDEEEVRRGYVELTRAWEPRTGEAKGLALWRYDGGYWLWHRDFDFGKP